jgi:hypothetical protein
VDPSTDETDAGVAADARARLRLSMLERAEPRLVIVQASADLGMSEMDNLRESIDFSIEPIDLSVESVDLCPQKRLPFRNGSHVGPKPFGNDAEVTLDFFDRIAVHDTPESELYQSQERAETRSCACARARSHPWGRVHGEPQSRPVECRPGSVHRYSNR